MCTTVPPAKSSTPASAPGSRRAPDPVRDRRVDQQRPQPMNHSRAENFMRSAKAPADQRRGDDREGHLEHHVDRFRDRLRRDRSIERRARHAACQQERGCRSPMYGAAGGEGEAVADDHPQHGDEAGDREALHDRGEHVLLAHHAAVEQREARDRHQQDERRRCQHPGRVAAVDSWEPAPPGPGFAPSPTKSTTRRGRQRRPNAGQLDRRNAFFLSLTNPGRWPRRALRR